MSVPEMNFYPVGPAIPNTDFGQWRDIWRKCRDVLAGEEAVKDAGTKYLPRMSRMTDAEYESYKMRAMFYGASQRTLQGLLGSILRKPPVIYADSDDTTLKIEQLVKNITQTGTDLHAFAREIVTEILSTGRVAVLVDAPPASANLLDPKPYARMYAAEDIINWRLHFEGGVPILDQVVLIETLSMPGADGFGIEQVTQYRELTLQDGDYVQRVWVVDPPVTDKDKATFRVIEEVTPKFKGKPMKRLPFFFCSASHNRPDIERPPLLDLFNVNLSHYRSSADLEHGRHFTALPTPVVSGVSTDDDSGTPLSLEIGSSTAWLLPENSSARMLEFNGQGLKHLENALQEKATLMANLGARMLEPDKRSSETAEALRLRQAGDFASMSTISEAVGAMLTNVVRLIAWWSNVTKVLDDERLFVQLNKDYFESRLTPAMLTSLVQAWQSGAMGFRDLYFNLIRGEMIDPERSFDEVKDEVQAEAALRAASVATTTGTPGMGSPGATPRAGQGTTATAPGDA